MQIMKSVLVVCAATICLTPVSLLALDDQAQTNAPAVSETKTNEATPSKAELKKQAEEQKKAEKAAKAEAEAKAKAEKAEKKKQADAEAKAKKEAAKSDKSQKPTTVKNLEGMPVIEPPPLPISTDKQQRLAELLKKYKADEVTPEEYHQQRAKILAEP